ncbi:MAG: polysaccharide biosynthesis protein [Bacteroidaceae bacterium]|nr:polysaccharide biosynthesis protein [Bacteroidaceae bacterium]
MNNPYSSIINWYFSRKALPYWCILLLDCAIVMFSGFIAAYLIMGGGNLASKFWVVSFVLLLVTGIFVFFFTLFHTYRGIIRYTSIVDLQRIAFATGCGTLATVMISGFAIYVYPPQYNPSEKIMNIAEAILFLFSFSTLMIWLVRVTVKIMFESFRTDAAVPVAIYGTKAGGIALAKSIASVSEKRFKLRCFISDATDTEGGYLMGKKIYHNGPDIVSHLMEHGVKAIMVSPLKTNVFSHNQKMIDMLMSAGIKILIMPREKVWTEESELQVSQLHDVEIEDLLPRDEIKVDLDAIGNLLRNKRILITGAAGSIGSEMVRQVAEFHPDEMILIDQAETPMNDIRLMMEKEFAYVKCETIVTSIANKTHMENIFETHRPQYVFHAAAYKHVPMMEDNPAIAVQNNVYGTRVIADLAVKYGTEKFVMISTDKAVNPTNVMGCSKRICEIYCQSLNKKLQDERKNAGEHVCQFVTTRFGNVLGSNGSVIPLFKKQIKEGGPITVTHPDIVRFFMLIPEACRLVLEAGTMGHGGEIFVFDMGNPVRIADLAKRMINLSGAQDIKIQFTGLRHGEKLYEEVLSDEENTLPTKHPKIKVAKVREYDYDTICNYEKELMELSFTHDDMLIVKKMKEIVPEYKSQVSKYEILDK